MTLRPARLAAACLGAALCLGSAGALAGGGRVHERPEAVEPLPSGSAVPEVQVLSVEAEPVDLAGLVRERGALLVFYRGGW